MKKDKKETSKIKYKVECNKDRKVVWCAIYGTQNDAIDIIKSKLKRVGGSLGFPISGLQAEFKYTKLPDKFVGVAKCSPEDEFDYEKGKKIAFHRAKIKYYRALKLAIDDYCSKFLKVALVFRYRTSNDDIYERKVRNHVKELANPIGLEIWEYYHYLGDAYYDWSGDGYTRIKELPSDKHD